MSGCIHKPPCSRSARAPVPKRVFLAPLLKGFENRLTMEVSALPIPFPLCYKHGMDKTIRKYTDPDDFEELKAEEYRYWQSRPVHERIAAVSELTQEHYALKGEAPDVPRLQRTLVRFERAPR